ncbi:MAG: TrkA family potassium uptake protein [Oscillospiraceae bacterium]|nr:TrkA family potassium uptake protein [Oscillospiraceae bacterium]MDD4367551.1 TrkA family potassium uptake protein [Oscillospiraceae bacterium]
MNWPQEINVNRQTQFAVLGLGKFGRSVAETLFANGYTVLACDQDENLVREAVSFTTHVVRADASDKAVLDRLGIQAFDVVIIAFSSDFEASCETVLILKELGVRYVIAKANGSRQKFILTSIGTDRVVMPEFEMGEQLAYGLVSNGLMAAVHRSDAYDIIETKVLPEWIGQSLVKLKLRQREGMNILAVIRGGAVLANLSPDTQLLQDDELVVLKSRES